MTPYVFDVRTQRRVGAVFRQYWLTQAPATRLLAPGPSIIRQRRDHAHGNAEFYHGLLLGRLEAIPGVMEAERLRGNLLGHRLFPGKGVTGVGLICRPDINLAQLDQAVFCILNQWLGVLAEDIRFTSSELSV